MLLMIFAVAGLAAGAGTPSLDVSLPSVAGPPADSLAIATLEHAWLQTSDTAVLGRMLAPDFMHIAPGGYLLTRAEHLAYVAAHPHVPGVRRRFERLDIRLYGNVAIANGIVAVRAPSRETTRTAFTDVFVKRDGRWQAVNAQENRMASGHDDPHDR